MRDSILAAGHKLEAMMSPLDRIDRVAVRLRLQYTLRALLGHQVDAHVMVGGAGGQENAARRKRGAYHLCLARSQLLVILYRFDGERCLAAARCIVLPEGYRTIGAGGHQVLEVTARRRTKVDGRDHARVAGEHGNGTSRLEIPDTEDSIQ